MFTSEIFSPKRACKSFRWITHYFLSLLLMLSRYSTLFQYTVLASVLQDDRIIGSMKHISTPQNEMHDSTDPNSLLNLRVLQIKLLYLFLDLIEWWRFQNEICLIITCLSCRTGFKYQFINPVQLVLSRFRKSLNQLFPYFHLMRIVLHGGSIWQNHVYWLFTKMPKGTDKSKRPNCV